MKNSYLIIFILFFFLQIHAQKKITGVEFTTKRIEKIDKGKIYDKKTGKKIKEKDFVKLVKSKKPFTLENVIDEKGQIEKYLLDQGSEKERMMWDVSERVNPGEAFPNFILKTIDHKTINLKDLRGKIVLIRFELFADNFRFKKAEIIEMDNQINQIKDKDEKVKAIIIFTSSKSDVLKGFDIKNSNFELVAEGMNFHQRYLINRYPTLIAIDKEGKLIDYYSFFAEIRDLNIKELVEKYE